MAIYGPVLPLHLLEIILALHEAAFGGIEEVVPSNWENEVHSRKRLPFRPRKVTFSLGDSPLRLLSPCKLTPVRRLATFPLRKPFKYSNATSHSPHCARGHYPASESDGAQA